MGGEAVDPLLLAMKSADPSMRGFLSAALCRIGPAAIERLKEAYASHDPDLRECASLTLWGMGESGVIGMMQAIERENEGP